ncbi:MAG TPA: O-antigen ligase family protein [Pyrinomonadaceae bacterium]|nr:O-antigen ligase family protein [Pyrinomonadaceae bacterium]
MRSGSSFVDYEPVTPSRRARKRETEETADFLLEPLASAKEEEVVVAQAERHEDTTPKSKSKKEAKPENWIFRRGHAISYAGLFLFTVVLYFRPYEIFTALNSVKSMAFWMGVFTLAAYLPSQLAAEGNLTARPREVNLLLLFCVAALISIPPAINPPEALATFVEFLRPVMIFIVMINVVRTEWRLKGIFFLTLTVSVVLSVGAIYDYRMARFSVEGYRVAGIIGNLFGNPNDMALHLVTVIPISVALSFTTRNIVFKILYAVCALLMIIGSMLTFSRSGFLGLVAAGAVIAWKIGRRNRLAVIVLAVVGLATVIAFAPAGYTNRLDSIVNHDADAFGSAGARTNLLFRSIKVAIANPVFGVGMGNFHIVSIGELVSHNAYTQVAAEMGMAAMVVYILFILSPFKGLRMIENETFEDRRASHFYYLAVGLQASLVAYMVSSFFASVAYQWYVYYLVGYAVCLRRLYKAERKALEEREAKMKEREEVEAVKEPRPGLLEQETLQRPA